MAKTTKNTMTIVDKDDSEKSRKPARYRPTSCTSGIIAHFLIDLTEEKIKMTEKGHISGVEIKDKDQLVSTMDEELGPIVSYSNPRVGPSGEDAPLLSKRVEQEVKMLCQWSKRRVVKEKLAMEESRVLDNGGQLLEKLIESCGPKYNPFRIFSKTELQKATNCYYQRCESSFSYGEFYIGIHEDRTVLVKKRIDDRMSNVARVLSEIAIALEIRDHKNIMKFLGCCLETKVPMLVYKYESKINLSNLLHGLKDKNLSSENHPSVLSWESKLKIVTDIAEAVTYMHVATSTPILHRNIKSSNIFLDEENVVKLFGFDLSLRIPLGEDHVEAAIEGTFGYLAPECLTDGLFTEKCDVYGFGCLLNEILTGMRPWEFGHWLTEEGSSSSSSVVDVVHALQGETLDKTEEDSTPSEHSSPVKEASAIDLYFSKEQLFDQVWIETEESELKVIPIWVYLKKVSSYLWTPHGIGKIANFIEYDIDKDLPSIIIIACKGIRKSNVEVEYNWIPIKCSECKVFRRSTLNCSKNVSIVKNISIVAKKAKPKASLSWAAKVETKDVAKTTKNTKTVVDKDSWDWEKPRKTVRYRPTSCTSGIIAYIPIDLTEEIIKMTKKEPISGVEIKDKNQLVSTTDEELGILFLTAVLVVNMPRY
ncbi:hypothetical protein GIB67_033745 [Kingdonia uniflora]|uniref:Protein kinase domain-containing protein n=1 Tax=Kingdonia uniflora TaxID=39325 RepID=A0A7J7P4G5_9MAGN|nr:hypothetical protein GIB67_033745 [Kingdonia uniflora]